MVGGEGVGQVVFAHHLEGDAIGERPGLVRSGAVEGDTSVEKFGGWTQ